VLGETGAEKVNIPKFNVVLADPPWSYSTSSSVAGGRGQNTSYRCLRPVEIYDLPVEKIVADDCVLFLWATYPMLMEALYTVKAWGFYYKTNAFTWLKMNRKADTPFFGMGQWTRRNTEICLLGTRGNPKALCHDISELVQSPIEEHSKKPDCVRDMIVRLCGDVPWVELFARRRTDGWFCWGDEVPSDFNLDDLK
jgi:N6-adenosine-specific RNA methylase IME4